SKPTMRTGAPEGPPRTGRPSGETVCFGSTGTSHFVSCASVLLSAESRKLAGGEVLPFRVKVTATLSYPANSLGVRDWTWISASGGSESTLERSRTSMRRGGGGGGGG